jgi:hypothetical protein
MTDKEPKQEPFILVAGQRVGLGALRRDLIPTYVCWRSDLEVVRWRSDLVPTVSTASRPALRAASGRPPARQAAGPV